MKEHLDTGEILHYRWVILGVSVVIFAITMGQIVNGLSIYFVPLETSFGWNRGDIALINTSGLVGLALGSIVMGFASEKFGTRRVALMGVVAIGVAIGIASRATELWQFYVLFFLAGGLGAGALSAPVMALVGNWFPVGAGLAIGIASAGQALGQGGIPFSASYLIEALGWRNAMMAQALITVAVLYPLAMFLRNAPASSANANFAYETPSKLPNALITAWLSLAVVFCCTCMAVPLIHLVPLIQDRGFSSTEASSVLLLMMMVAIAGRVAFGKLADWIGAIPAFLTASAWQTALVFGFFFFENLNGFYIYAAVYGFGYAGVMTTIIVTARNLTAPARRASSLGIILAFAYLGHGLGGWQGGFFFDVTGGYQWTYANAAIVGVINLVIVSALWITINRRPVAALP